MWAASTPATSWATTTEGVTLVHNGQTRLTATDLNGVAIAIFAMGGLESLIPALSDNFLSDGGGAAVLSLVVSGVLGGLSFGNHDLTRRVPRRLAP